MISIPYEQQTFGKIYKACCVRVVSNKQSARVRSHTLGEFIGQEEIVGPGKLLRRAIEADQLISTLMRISLFQQQ